MISAETYHRPSRTVRAMLPEEIGEPHPRAIELADKALDIAARGSGVTFKDLIQEGFTNAEIIEHSRAAERINTDRQDKQITVRPDLVADIKLKAREANSAFMPLPRGTTETQALTVLWGTYCAARAALLIDPTIGQRQRCLNLLGDYLARLPSVFPSIRADIVADVAARLPKVPS